MADPSGKIYQLKIHLVGISPMVWRRILLGEGTTIAQLHEILQITMGWENIHLHCFRIFGKDYGVSYTGGMFFGDDPDETHLSKFRFKKGDKFFYDYNFHVNWKHQIRVEKILKAEAKKKYPVCTGGNNACPPENTLSFKQFSLIRDLYRYPFYDLLKIMDFQEHVGYPWRPDVFKRGIINSMLRNTKVGYFGQNDPLFPDRTSPYFEDKYWHKKDDFQALKKMYRILKFNGVEVKDESDGFMGEATGWKVFQTMLGELLKPGEAEKPNGPSLSVDGTPQNS